LHAQAVGFGSRMTEAVVANRTQSNWQDMAQVAAHELNSGQIQSFDAVVVVSIFPTKRDGVFVDLEDAPIVDGSASDVVAEIFDGGGPGTCRLDVDSPVFGPDLRIDLPIVVPQEAVHVLSEGPLQIGQVD